MRFIEILENIKIEQGSDGDFPETLDIIESIEKQILKEDDEK